MNSDVRDILELETSSKKDGSNKDKKKRLVEPMKRPNGVNREVWRLIYKDDRDQPPLIPTEEPKVYKNPKVKFRFGSRKWKWVGFKNAARTDDAVFHHWRLANDETKDYPFAIANKKTHLPSYTDAEYGQYLEDDNWTRGETDYLFQMCKQYDLRFFVVNDRWDSKLHNKSRTIDEIKDRYYKVIGTLERIKQAEETAVATTTISKEIFMFDIEHEKKRREQLEKLFNRTKEQIEEEQYLLEELKKIEIRKRERERRSQDVSKLLTAVDMNINLAAESAQQPSTPAAVKRTKQRKSSMQTSGGEAAANVSITSPSTTPASTSNAAADLNNSKNKKSLIFKANVDTGIKFPDSKTAGVSLRSYKMKLPASVGLKKSKAIDQLLERLQIEPRPIATEMICDQFNDLRSDMVLLYELNQGLSNCEFELQSLKHRYEAIHPGKVGYLDETRLLVSSHVFFKTLDLPTVDTTTSSNLSHSLIETPQKRISEAFEGTITPGSLERKRRSALNQANILKKLRGRNVT